MILKNKCPLFKVNKLKNFRKQENRFFVVSDRLWHKPCFTGKLKINLDNLGWLSDTVINYS